MIQREEAGTKSAARAVGKDDIVDAKTERMKSRKLVYCEKNAVAQMSTWCYHRHQYFVGSLLKKRADFEAHYLSSLRAGKLRGDVGKRCLAEFELE